MSTPLPTPPPRDSRLGLALAGGGPLGIIYEIGALQALAESIEGLHCQALSCYVGVSAGAVLAASLANGFSPVELGRIFISNDLPGQALDPGIFLRPALREYARRLGRLPGLSLRAGARWLRHPTDPWQMLADFSQLLPAGIFDNEPVRRELLRFFSLPGRSDDFRQLAGRLHIVAVDLDSAEPVIFGAPPHAHIPISRAVQASSALPGLYPPVEIEGRHYVDGALVKTLHASVALDSGVDLLFCINPIVPIHADRATRAGHASAHLSEGGLSVVMSQALRALIHSRLQVGMARYQHLYPDTDVLLFEPERADAMLFFSNVFSFNNRDRVCEYAYQTMRRDLWQRRDTLAPVLARHGLVLREALLADPRRRFADALAAHRALERRRQFPQLPSHRLHGALDRLQGWLQQQR